MTAEQELAIARQMHDEYQREINLWRRRVTDTRPILNLVEDVSDDPTPASVAALVDAFNAWRMCVERGVPAAWGVAGEPDPAQAEQPADVEPPFRKALT